MKRCRFGHIAQWSPVRLQLGIVATIIIDLQQK
jgi:hypothetical protein